MIYFCKKDFTMKSNIILEKSIRFSLNIMEFTRYLKNEFKEYDLSRQLFKAGTSIGANIAESQYASSRKDFVNKLHIALKEANETWYWLMLIEMSGAYKYDKFQNLKTEIKEIKKILTKIIVSSKPNSVNK